MDTFKIFTTRFAGAFDPRHIMSLRTINLLLDSSAASNYPSWDSLRTAIINKYGCRFNSQNFMCMSLHELIEIKDTDPQPFKNSCIVFKVYDL